MRALGGLNGCMDDLGVFVEYISRCLSVYVIHLLWRGT